MDSMTPEHAPPWPALAAEIDARAGCARSMGEAEQEHFHGLCGAMACLAESLNNRVSALASEALGIRPE
jgi:hypothetical protein